MLYWLVTTALKFRVLVLACAAALAFFGIERLRTMSVDALPEFAAPVVEIQTEAQGLSAKEVEIMVTFGVEELVNGLPWTKSLRSESVAGLSTVRVEFERGTDLMKARQLVQERLTTAFLLPNVAKAPVMQQPTSATNRVMMISLTSKEVDPLSLSVVTLWTVKPRLLGVPGVANVSIWGERRRQLQIQIDPDKLRAHGLRQEHVIASTGDSLWMSSLTYLKASTPGTGGWLEGPNQRLEIRHVLPMSSAADMARINVEGTKLAIGDVARVVEGHPPMIGDAVFREGNGLLLVIEKFPGANTVAVTQAVEAALADLKAGLTGVAIDSQAFRPATFVEWSVVNAGEAGLAALLLLLLGLAGFLMRGHIQIVAVATICLSLLAASLVLHFRGASLNALVVAGFAAALASIIDDIVVAADSLARQWRSAGRAPSTTPELIASAAIGLRRPLIHATLASLATLVPVYFIEGIDSDFFQPLATSYALALVAALLISLTVAPTLTALLLAWTGARAGAGMPMPASSPSGGTAGAMARLASRPSVSLLTAVLLAAVVVATVPHLLARVSPQLGLLPTFRERDLIIQFDGPPGTSLPEMTRLAGVASEELRAINGVRSVSAHVGRAMLSDQTVTVSSGKLWVSINSSADFDRVRAEVERTIDGYPSMRHQVQTYLGERLAREQTGGRLVTRVFGHETAALRAVARSVRDAMARIDGLADARVIDFIEEPQIQVRVDLAAASKHGLKPGDVRRAAATYFSGIEVGKIFEAQKVFDVVVWSTPETRRSVESISDAMIELPRGGHVRIGDVAKVTIEPTTSLVKRNGISLYLDVIAEVRNRPLPAITRDLQARLNDIQFPLGYHPVIQGRQDGGIGITYRVLGAAVVIAGLIVLLLQACLGNWRLAFGVFAATPLAASGALAAASLTGQPFTLATIAAVFGIYALALRQALALASCCQEAQAGHPRGSAASQVAGCLQERTRPVLATAFAMALACLPAVYLAGRPGLELLGPMAVAMLGGLASTLLVVLLVLPGVCTLLASDGEPDLELELAR